MAAMASCCKKGGNETQEAGLAIRDFIQRKTRDKNMFFHLPLPLLGLGYFIIRHQHVFEAYWSWRELRDGRAMEKHKKHQQIEAYGGTNWRTSIGQKSLKPKLHSYTFVLVLFTKTT